MEGEEIKWMPKETLKDDGVSDKTSEPVNSVTFGNKRIEDFFSGVINKNFILQKFEPNDNESDNSTSSRTADGEKVTLMEELSDINSILEFSFNGKTQSNTEFGIGVEEAEQKVARDINKQVEDFPFELFQRSVSDQSVDPKDSCSPVFPPIQSDQNVRKSRRLSDHFQKILSHENNSIETNFFDQILLQGKPGKSPPLPSPSKDPSAKTNKLVESPSKIDSPTKNVINILSVNTESQVDESGFLSLSPLTKTFNEASLFILNNSSNKKSESKVMYSNDKQEYLSELKEPTRNSNRFLTSGNKSLEFLSKEEVKAAESSRPVISSVNPGLTEPIDLVVEGNNETAQDLNKSVESESSVSATHRVQIQELTPSKLIVNSAKKRSSLTDPLLLRTYNNEVQNILSRHLNMINSDNLSKSSHSRKSIILSIEQELIKILDNLTAEIEKLSKEHDHRIISSMNSDFLSVSKSKESNIKRLMFDKIKNALIFSGRNSYFKTAIYKLDSFYDSLSQIQKRVASHFPSSQSRSAHEVLLTKFQRLFGLKIVKASKSSVDKTISYNFCYMDSLILIFKTGLESAKILFLQVFLVKLPEIMKRKIKSKNALSDFLIGSFKNRVEKGYSLNLVESISYICKLYKIIYEVFILLSGLVTQNKIEDFEFDKKNKFIVSLVPKRLSFLVYEVALEISSDLKVSIGFELKLLDNKTIKVFDKAIKQLNGFIREEVTKISLGPNFNPRSLDTLFNEIHQQTFFKASETGDVAIEPLRIH